LTPQFSRRLLASVMATLLVASGLAAPANAVSAPAIEHAAAPRLDGLLLNALPATSLNIRYVVVVVMENRSYGQIVGSPSAPYLNGLAKRYGLATNYQAVSHPSEPNYLALFGGSTFGVADDAVHTISGTNIADQLERAGLTWRVSAENVPPGCFTGATAFARSDGKGWYARKHEPAISFANIQRAPARCAQIQPLGAFRAGAASVQFVFPNMCHDMHDCSTATGDAFLRAWLPKVLGSPTFAQTLLVITWDEGSGGPGGGQVATIVAGPRVAAGTRSAAAFSHYSIVRTIDDLFGLPCLRNACKAANLLGFLH
jgi:phospholipase C